MSKFNFWHSSLRKIINIPNKVVVYGKSIRYVLYYPLIRTDKQLQKDKLACIF
ncbi:hypothetical protein JCM15457_1142 [Liquorilactobacillus sucicola DSM 21376 = JCM 15457]|nr:hypothetical protein JCM15457_1142 [Liquorilactobacillus sucicola DSM 21376 = JCM 15457]